MVVEVTEGKLVGEGFSTPPILNRVKICHLILVVSQKLILNPKLYLTTIIWKYLVATLLEKITHLTLNLGEFVFIIKTHYLSY